MSENIFPLSLEEEGTGGDIGQRGHWVQTKLRPH